MVKKPVYPPARIDRLLLWGGWFLLLLAYALIVIVFGSGRVQWVHWATMVLGFALVWGVVYRGQSAIPPDDFHYYTVVIADIEDIGTRLSRLSDFLKQERQRVADYEATLNRLQAEKTELEPIVTTEREKASAILNAYAKTTASKIWKERALGFISGTVTSLLASLIFEVLRK